MSSEPSTEVTAAMAPLRRGAKKTAPPSYLTFISCNGSFEQQFWHTGDSKQQQSNWSIVPESGSDNGCEPGPGERG
ncbi:hypothetical protein ACEPPN_000697 [Leptodophora sp. 'Broadleaf-Isolate-01']